MNASPRACSALLIAALALLVCFGAGTASADLKGKKCGELVFTPGTTDRYAHIRASRMKCEKARRLLRDYRFHNPNDRLGPRGWDCRAQRRPDVGASFHCGRIETKGKARLQEMRWTTERHDLPNFPR